eukprot:ANDGO_01949.mRNA.1 AUGMIN subunit 1
MEIDSEKLSEVTGWLRRVFQSDSVPVFEVTPETIEMLHILSRLHKIRCTEQMHLLSTIQKESESYKSRNGLLRTQLENVGLSLDSFSSRTKQNLLVLGSTAAELGLERLSLDSLVISTDDLIVQREKAGHLVSELREHAADVDRLHSETSRLLNSVEKVSHNIAAEVDSRRAETSEKEEQLGYLRTKAAEYRAQADESKASLGTRGLHADITHTAIQKLAERVAALEAALKPLQEKLTLYNNLPPDVSLARLQIETTRAKLESAESKLGRLLSSSGSATLSNP